MRERAQPPAGHLVDTRLCGVTIIPPLLPMRLRCFGRLAGRRRLPNRIDLWVVFLLMIAPGVTAFVPRNLHNGYPADAVGLVMKWDLAAYPDGAIPYWINPTIPAGFTPFEPTNSIDVILAKVHNAFRAWENVSTAKVKFRFAGFTEATDHL